MVQVQLPIQSKQELENAYVEASGSFERALYECNRRIKKLLAQNGIVGTVKYRVKSFHSYYQKIQYRSRTTPASDTVLISDVMGIRIVCPFLDDLTIVEQLIAKSFDIQEKEEKGAEFSFKEFGYDSLHFLVLLPRDIIESFHLNDFLLMEIQLRTILQDAWAEVEHELVYKSHIAPFDINLRRKLAALNANLSLSDMVFHEIRMYQRELQHQLEKCRASFMDIIQKNSWERESASLHSTPPERTVFKNLNTQENQLLEALYAHNAGQYTMAVDIYGHILDDADSQLIHPVVYLYRGMALFAMGEYDRSMENFSSTLSIDPYNEDALLFRELKLGE